MDRGKFTLDDTGGSEPSDSATPAGFLTIDGSGDSGSDGGSSGSDSGGIDRDANGDEWDERIHSSPPKRNADGSWRKKRGRGASSASSGNRRKANNQAGIDALTRALVIVHLGISKATAIPEIELDSDDADTLAQATANVLQEFDIKPDPKVEAIFGLIVAAGSVYAPKVIIYNRRKQTEKEENKSNNSTANVYGMSGHGAQKSNRSTKGYGNWAHWQR